MDFKVDDHCSDNLVAAGSLAPRRFRFGLRTLFVVMTAAAVAFAAYRAYPEGALIAAVVVFVVVAYAFMVVVPLVCLFAAAFLVETILLATGRCAHWLWHCGRRLPSEK